MRLGERSQLGGEGHRLRPVPDAVARVGDAQVVALEPALRADPAGQQPERQRRVAQDRDAVTQAERHQLRLDVAVHHAELFLDGIERAGGHIGLHVRRADVARADRPDLAGPLQILERAHRLGDRRRRVLPVGDVEVDMVGAEAAQALLDLVRDRVPPEVAVHRLAVLVEEVVALGGVPDEPALRGEHHLVAAAGDGLADDLLRAAHAVGRRRVDQADAGVDRGPDRGDRRGLVGAAPHPAADRPGAEADGRGADAGAADLARLHRDARVMSRAPEGRRGRWPRRAPSP